MRGLYLVTPNWDDTDRLLDVSEQALHEELDADGVHVGGTDASVAQVRARLGKEKIVGASCYGDMALARTAEAGGASYVAFGGFYPSLVKKYPVTTPLDIVLQAKREIALPCVVIGGMTPDNAAPLVARGADMVAAITSVYQADDIDIAVQQFNQLFAACAREWKADLGE